MRIFGGHDYYDSSLAYGRDETITLTRYENSVMYDRDTELATLIPERDIGLRWDRTRSWGLQSSIGAGIFHASISRVTVVFCDRVYFGVQFGNSYKPTYYWSAERLLEAIHSVGETHHFPGLTVEPIKRNSWGHEIHGNTKQRQRQNKKKAIDDLSAHLASEPVSEQLREFMIANRLAILVRMPLPVPKHDKYTIVNPYNLKKLDFARAVDPFTAFQELSMWIGGVLGGVSPEVVTITDDKVLVENHGFDRHSFRSSSREG